ncbi:MAG: DUF1302 family protein [Halopseudomonas sp.]
MNKANALALMLAAVASLLAPAVSAGLSGTWELESAYNSHQREAQKLESLLDLEWNSTIGDDSYLTAIGRLRLDREQQLRVSGERADSYSPINGPSWVGDHGELSLRELYLDSEWAGAVWRLGKQQVVWGEADGLKVLDQVNPQSFREFILDEFDDSRIPTWMINAEFAVDEASSLQLLWIFDTTYHELASFGSAYAVTRPASIPTPPAGISLQLLPAVVPDDPLQDSELGLRYSAFIEGWDLTLNYLYHYNDFPVLYRSLQGSTLLLQPEYERSHLLGGSLSNSFGELTLRAEIGFNSDSFFISRDLSQRGIANSGELSSVIGLDWHGLRDTLLSAQWFQSHLLDHTPAIVRDRTEHSLSLLYERTFANQTWTFKTLVLQSLNDKDGLVRPKLTFNVQSSLDLWLGADVFYGNRQGLYGQFDDQDRILIGMELGF